MGTVNGNGNGNGGQPPPATAVYGEVGLGLKAPASGGTGFLDKVADVFSEGVKNEKAKLKDILEKLKADPTDPGLLASYQAKLSEYTMYRNAQSNTVKAFKDVDANTVRNFN
jgi:type III secretion protein F